MSQDVRPGQQVKTYVLRDELDKARCIRAIQRAECVDPRGRPLLVVCRRKSKKRTLKQNSMMHMLWSMFEVLADWGEGEAKEWFKDNYGPVITRHFGSGVKRREVTMAKPSAKYTLEEAEAMIDEIYKQAAVAGFVLPEPHDEESFRRWYESMEKAA